jgi:LAO/AO transport system kinase
VVRTVAARSEGIDEILAAVAKHRAWLRDHGELAKRREARAAAEVEAIALAQLRDRMGSLRGGTALAKLATAVAAGELDPYAAARNLLAGLEGL